MAAERISPTEWAWADLHETGPEAESRAQEAARQRREVQEAYERGYREGEHAGATKARDDLGNAMQATQGALEEVSTAREVWEGRLQERLVVLAAAMAQKVIEHVHQRDPAMFVELAKQAVAAFPVQEPIRIRLHPADHALLTTGGFVPEVVGERAVRWISDDEVVPGGCIVEGPDRIVDARIDEALTRVVKALTHG